MATNNFIMQKDFPLFYTRYFDGYEYENEETGEIEFYESDYYDFKRAEADLLELNAELSYYRIIVLGLNRVIILVRRSFLKNRTT